MSQFTKTIKQRHPELDLLRTIAISMMLIHHFCLNLKISYGWDINMISYGWETWRITCVSLFLLLVGACTNFSTRPMRRALIVLLSAFLITIITGLYDPRLMVRFGILHNIGVTLLFLPLTKPLREWNIVLGILIILAQNFLHLIDGQMHLLPIGLPSHFSLDYYPLVPWMGISFIGLGLGHYLYKRKHLQLHLTLHPVLTLPGQHSLLIYFVHVPIMLALLPFLF